MSKNTIDNASDLSVADLAPFTTVDNGGARPLKAISAAEFAALDDGDMVYVQSVRDYWKWVPASTATDDSTGAAAQLQYCNPTVNGANPGRFERLFIASPDWLLQNFFVNTATGHNENDGATALTPINNDREIFQRWGPGKRAAIATAITITWAQSPSVQTNLMFEILLGGALTFVGTPLVTKVGSVLTAVTVQDRTTQTRWAITAGALLDATDLGKLYVITASGIPANVGAYAEAIKDNGANQIIVTPFGTYNNTTGAFTVITPAVGDTIEVRAMTATTLIGNIEGFGTYSGTQLGTSKVVFDSIHLASAAGANQASSIRACGVGFVYTRCTFASIVLSGPTFNNTSGHFWRGGGGISGCVIAIRGAGAATFSQIGMLNGFFTMTRGSQVVTTSDCYFQNTNVTPVHGGTIISSGCAFFDRSSASQNLFLAPGAVFQQSGAIPDWGTNNAGFGIFLQSTSFYSYATKPTINSGLGAGREASIGGTDTLLVNIPYIEGANNASMVLTA